MTQFTNVYYITIDHRIMAAPPPIIVMPFSQHGMQQIWRDIFREAPGSVS